MTEKNKKLLLNDLCARLPYGIFVKEERESLDPGPVVYTYDYHPYINDCKPYLRPMNTMTKVEKEEYRKLCKKVVRKMYVSDGKCIPSGKTSYRYFGTKTEYYDTYESIEYLVSRHFDYRGLIGKKLALKATKGMYEI